MAVVKSIDVTFDVRSHDKSLWRKVSTVGTLSAVIQYVHIVEILPGRGAR